MSVKIDYGKGTHHPTLVDAEKDRSKISINWDEVRERYYARIREEIARGLVPPERGELPEYREVEAPSKPAKRKTRTPRTKVPGRGWNRQYDHDEFVRLYESGWSGNDIAKKFGCNPATVYGALKARGVTREYNGGINAHTKQQPAS